MEAKPTWEQIIDAYVAENSEGVNLSQFIIENTDVIILHTKIDQWDSIERLWGGRLKEVARRQNVTMKYGKVNQQCMAALSKACATKAKQVPQPTVSPKQSTSSSAASKTDSYSLTEEARLEFENMFKEMKNEEKWELRAGVYVEDLMYEFGKQCTHEHPVHSFILNTSDACWKEVFGDDLAAIRTFGNYALPKLDDSVLNIFKHYDGVTGDDTLESIIDKMQELGPYHPRTQPDLYKLHHAIGQFVGYYVDNVFAGVSAWTEQDFVTYVWSILDRFFHPSGFMTSRDQTCLASSQRINSERGITGKSMVADKKRSIRPDLVLLKHNLEYGCSELGTNLSTVPDKKEIVETDLHSPKTMKDMLCAAIHSTNSSKEVARKLKIICFNQTALTMSLSVMDSPAGYVTRIVRSSKCEVPRTPELVVSQLFSVLKLALKAKKIVDESFTTVIDYLKIAQEPDLDFESSSQSDEKLMLPRCLSTPILPQATRKRRATTSDFSPASKRSSTSSTNDPSSS